MTINLAHSYPITHSQFDSLFTNNIEKNTIEQLTQSALSGDLDSIDLLYNLALRQDDTGKQVENILFDIFSGKITGKKDIEQKIKKTSQMLYQSLVHDKTKNNKDVNKLRTPSKLLYIAGSASQNISEQQNITAIFTNRLQCPTQEGSLYGANFWCNNRMLTTDEINAATHKLAQYNSNISINYPIGLTQSNCNFLSVQIQDKITNSSGLNTIELFPVNTGDHWVLFALYHDQSDDQIKSVVFNSYNPLNPAISEQLRESALEAQIIDQEHVTFIEENMQQNVPNGCGIFVIKAIESILQSPCQNPIDTINLFTKNFIRRSREEQTQFNQHSRQQLFSSFIEEMYQ